MMKCYLMLLLGAVLFQPTWGQSAPSGATTQTTIASRDPYADDLAAANSADQEWRSAKNALEDLGSGCAPDGDQIIDKARSTKQRAIGSYSAYYQKTIAFWRKIRDGSGSAEITGRAGAAELRAHLDQLQRELAFASNRRAELQRSLELNHVSGDPKALGDLRDIESQKQEQVEKAQAAIEQNELGRGYILKRAEYARQRMEESQELLNGLTTESYLYQELYNAVFHRYHLSCDRNLPHPQRYESDWRNYVQRLGEKTQYKQQ